VVVKGITKTRKDEQKKKKKKKKGKAIENSVLE